MNISSKDYPGIPHARLREDSRLKNLRYENPKLVDVEKSFEDVSPIGNFLAIHDNDLFKRNRYSGRNRGDSTAKTHFQGVCRIRNGKSFVFSGGDSLDSAAQVFSASVMHFKDNISFPDDMPSVTKGKILRGPIGSNTYSDKKPPKSDKLNFITQVNDYVVDGKDEKGFWHAGGISVAGDILAVPLESSESSLIRFFSVKNPNKPVHIEGIDIQRPDNIGKAGTATLCRLKNNRFLCAVWQDGNNAAERKIDFYVSKDDKLENGFLKDNVRWLYKNMEGLKVGKTKFQVLEFVVQEDDQIYLVGTENDSPISPLLDTNGKNFAELMKVDFDLNVIDRPDAFLASIKISLIQRKQFDASDDYHSFSAGGGIYISSDRELMLYSIYHYLNDDEIRMVEFPKDISTYDGDITEISRAKIELYEKENFKGKVIRIYGRSASDIADYEDYFAQGKKFKKGVGSVKYILPRDCVYAFYGDKDFEGGPIFVMNGKGSLSDKDKLGNIGKKVRSSKFTRINGVDV